jgi:hypothetical protein
MCAASKATLSPQITNARGATARSTRRMSWSAWRKLSIARSSRTLPHNKAASLARKCCACISSAR